MQPMSAPLVGRRSPVTVQLPRGRFVVHAAVLIAAYYGGASFGLSLADLLPPPSVSWIPGAVLLGSLLVTPRKYWTALVACAVLAHLAAAWQSHVPAATSFACLVGNLAQGLVGATVVRRLTRETGFSIVQLRSIGALLAGAACAAAAASAVAAAFWAVGQVLPVLRPRAGGWTPRFLADTFALLSIVPLFAAWSTGPALWRHWSVGRRIEAAVVTGVLGLLGLSVFDGYAFAFASAAAVYLSLPLLLWSAIRLGPVVTTTLLAAVALFAVWASAHGPGPFGIEAGADATDAAHLFLVSGAMSVLLLGAVVAQNQVATQDLRRSERRFALAFDANPNAVSIVAADGRILDVNLRWCDMFGHERGRAVGATLAEIGLDLDPGDAGSVATRATRGWACEAEVRVRDAGGRMRDVALAMAPTTIEGTPCSVVTFTDIGDRLGAEKALRDSDERFRFVLEATRHLVYDRDVDTGATWLSRGGLAQFGYGDGKTPEPDLAKLIHPDDRSRVAAHLVDAVGAGARACEVDYRLRRADGSYAQVREQAFIVPARPPQGPRVIGAVADVTDQHLHAELGQRLARASRMTAMGELTAAIAHEIRQPVSAILSNVDAAEILLEASPSSSEELHAVLADIRSDDLRIGEIVRHVRALATKRVLEVETFDINEVIATVLRIVGPAAQRRRSRIVTDLHPVPLIRGDRIHIKQVVLNLLLNALDALDEMPDGRRSVRVSTGRDDEGLIEIVVADSGRGVERSRRDTIFDSFVTSKKEGMGLGLAISRSIVESHGGHIGVEDNPGGGALFRVSLRERTEEDAVEGFGHG